MKKFFNKRMLSFLLALLMVLELAPLSALHVHATEADDTDLSIDFDYSLDEYNDTPEEALHHQASNGHSSYSISKEEAEEMAWFRIYDGDLKREGGRFREAMESSDPDEKYIVLAQDVDLRYGSGEWRPIKVTSDKVLDLNGFTLTWWDNTNKEKDENWQSTNIYDHYEDKVFINIAEGATLTIIDSSAPVNGYNTGKGTGKMEAAAQVIDAYEQQLDFYTHRDLFLVDGNLVIYGGTFQAGRQKDQYQSNFTWDKLADSLGKTLDLGLSIAEYATGLNGALAAMDDVDLDIANRKPANGNTSNSSDTGDTAGSRPNGEGGTQNQTVQTPASAGGNTSADRAQTITERTETANGATNNPAPTGETGNSTGISTNAEGSGSGGGTGSGSGSGSGSSDAPSTGQSAAQTGGQNNANAQGTAKEDKNSLIAAEEKKVVQAALDKDKIMDMFEKTKGVVASIGSMIGNAEGTRTTQTIWGTVARVKPSGTLVVYDGTFQGHGSSPNLRNAAIEIVDMSAPSNDPIKQKSKNAGHAYIFGGIFEGYAGANVFNFVRPPMSGQTGAARPFLFWAEGHAVTKFEYLDSTWTGDYKMNDKVVWSGTIEYPYTYNLDASETNNMEVLHYENQDAVMADKTDTVEPIPVDTSNVIVRGGTFRTFTEITNQGIRLPYMREIDPTGESMTFVKFTGTAGSVNLGVESFGEDLIRDGRIQLNDVYGDGTLVLMDEKKDEAHPAGLKHYRLYCGDRELRHIRYLDVYPMNAGANSTHSFALQTYYGEKNLYNVSTWNSENDEENDHTAPFAGDEYFFDFEYDGSMREDIYVMPNMDGGMYGEHMRYSDAWYYPDPVDSKGNPIPDFASTIPVVNFWYEGEEYLANAHYMKDLYIFDWDDYEDFVIEEYRAQKTQSYRENLKWFRYRVYRVDPITRENINENLLPTGDDPLLEVVYGIAEDDAMKCKIHLEDIRRAIEKKLREEDKLGEDEEWSYKSGELYRIVFNVDEYVTYGYTGFGCGTDMTMSFNYEEQVGDDWSIKGDPYERESESFAGYMPVASTESTVLFRCSSMSEQKELPNTDATSYVHYDTNYTPLQFDTYAVMAGETATINFVNAKVSQADNAGVDFIDVYYQWYISDDPFISRDPEDATKVTDTLLAGMTNVCLDWSVKEDHQPHKWNPDKDIYDYRNSLSPDDPNYSEYGEDGLPDDPNFWTMYDLHAYTTEMRPNRLCIRPEFLTGDPKEDEKIKLSMGNNNPFAFNTDSCYIPMEMDGENVAGKYLYVKVVVVNAKDNYTKIYDKKQVFYSHPMLIIDPSMLNPATQQPAMDLGHMAVDGAYVSKTVNATVGKDMLFGFTGYDLPNFMDKEGFKIRLSQKVYDQYTGEVIYEADNGEMINLKNFVSEPGQYYVEQTQVLYYKRPYYSPVNDYMKPLVFEETVTSRVDRFPVTVDLPTPDKVEYDYAPRSFEVGEEVTFTATATPEAPNGVTYWYKWVLLDNKESLEDCTVLQDSASPTYKHIFTDETPIEIGVYAYSKAADGTVSQKGDWYLGWKEIYPSDEMIATVYVDGKEVEDGSTVQVELGSTGTIEIVISGGAGDIRCTAYDGWTVIGEQTTISYDTSALGTKNYSFHYGDSNVRTQADIAIKVCAPLSITDQSAAERTIGYATSVGLMVQYIGTGTTVEFQKNVSGTWQTINSDSVVTRTVSSSNSEYVSYNTVAIDTVGTHSYRAVVTDMFGNTETVNYTIVYDNTVATEIPAVLVEAPTIVTYRYGDSSKTNELIYGVDDDLVIEFTGKFDLDPTSDYYADEREDYGNVKPVIGELTGKIYIDYYESYEAYMADDDNYTDLTGIGGNQCLTGSVNADGTVTWTYDADLADNGNGDPGLYVCSFYLYNNGEYAHTRVNKYGEYAQTELTTYLIMASGEEHVCDFTYKISDQDYDTHTWQCICGKTKVEAHEWDKWTGHWSDDNLETRWCPVAASDVSIGGVCMEYQYRLCNVDSLTLQETEITDAQIDSSIQLNASLKFLDMAEDTTLDGQLVDPVTDLIWDSSDESVATVDENGLVTIVGVGTATISVTSVATDSSGAAVTASCNITVVCDHGNVSIVNAKASDCTNAGWVEHYECSACGTVSLDGTFTDGKTLEDVTLPLASHEVSNVFGYNAEGHFRTCKYGCGYQFGAVTAHTYNVSAADCTTAKYCTRCKYEAEVKHGHSLIHMDELPATCTDDGIAACYNCMECGKYFYDEAGTLETTEAKLNIRKLGHQWADATCTDPKTCTRCGETEGSALGHNWLAATCSDPETCNRCGTTQGSALGHTWDAATCTAPKTCSTCLTTEGDKLPHSHNPADADCEHDAVCPVCNRVIIPATGHSFGDPVETPATCTEDGSITGTCTVCGETVTEVIPATGHDYVDGTCKNCGESEPGSDITVQAAAAIAYTVNGNVVTVTHSAACKVGYLVDGAYVKIPGTKNADGSYSFTAPAGVTEVVIVVVGDVTGDGKILAIDKTRLNAALLKKATLDAKATFAADVSGDGKLLAIDKTRLNAVLLKKTELTW